MQFPNYRIDNQRIALILSERVTFLIEVVTKYSKQLTDNINIL